MINEINKKYYLIIPYIIIAMLCIKIEGSTYLILATLIPLSIAILSRNITTIKIKYALLIFSIIVYGVMCIISTDIISAIKGYMSILYMIIPIIIYDFVISKNLSNEKFLNKIKVLICILLIYTIGVTWHYLNTDIYFARNLANYTDLTNTEYGGLAIASGGRICFSLWGCYFTYCDYCVI